MNSLLHFSFTLSSFFVFFFYSKARLAQTEQTQLISGNSRAPNMIFLASHFSGALINSPLADWLFCFSCHCVDCLFTCVLVYIVAQVAIEGLYLLFYVSLIYLCLFFLFLVCLFVFCCFPCAHGL